MELNFLQKIISVLVANFAELCFFGAIMLALQYWLPAWRGQKNWDRSSRLDIAYSFILAFITPFFAALPIAMVDALINLSPQLSGLPAYVTQSMPFFGQLLIALVLIDLVSYWRHRIMHMKWLWPIHAIHHCSIRLNWLSTERFHVLNYIISSVLNTIVVQLLFGPEVALIGAFLRRLYNFFIHANVDIDYGVFGYIFVSPRFHHWHHSLDERATDKNYCTFFSCIDWIFGTFYLPGNKVPAGQLGVKNDIAENLIDQFLYPFKTWYSWLRSRTA